MTITLHDVDWEDTWKVRCLFRDEHEVGSGCRRVTLVFDVAGDLRPRAAEVSRNRHGITNRGMRLERQRLPSNQRGVKVKLASRPSDHTMLGTLKDRFAVWPIYISDVYPSSQWHGLPSIVLGCILHRSPCIHPFYSFRRKLFKENVLDMAICMSNTAAWLSYSQFARVCSWANKGERWFGVRV